MENDKQTAVQQLTPFSPLSQTSLSQPAVAVKQVIQQLTPFNSPCCPIRRSSLEKDRHTAVSVQQPTQQPIQQPTQQLTPFNPLSRTSSRSSMEKDKQTAVISAVTAASTQQLTQQPIQQLIQQPTQQLTPVNPLSRTPSRSRSNSPMTFTSCVKVQYKPRTVPNQPLYGFNQFQDRTPSQKNSNMNDLSRSRSATAIISTSNSSNGIYHAKPYHLDLSNDVSSVEERNTSPPPRPPLPKNYESPYFLSLPRDWQELTRSSSYSAMLC